MVAEALLACAPAEPAEALPPGAAFALWRIATSDSLVGPAVAPPVDLRLFGPRDLEEGAQQLGLVSGSRAEGLREADRDARLAEGSRADALAAASHDQSLGEGSRTAALVSEARQAALAEGSGTAALAAGSGSVALDEGSTDRALGEGSTDRALGEGSGAASLGVGERARGGVRIEKELRGGARLDAGQGRRTYELTVTSDLSAPTEELVVVDFVPSPLRVVSAPGSIVRARPGGTLVVWLDHVPLAPRRERVFRVEVTFDSRGAR